MTTEIEKSTERNSGVRVDTIVERIADHLGVTVKASTVYGEPVDLVMLSLRVLGRQSGRSRTFWEGLRR